MVYCYFDQSNTVVNSNEMQVGALFDWICRHCQWAWLNFKLAKYLSGGIFYRAFFSLRVHFMTETDAILPVGELSNKMSKRKCVRIDERKT